MSRLGENCRIACEDGSGFAAVVEFDFVIGHQEIKIAILT